MSWPGGNQQDGQWGPPGGYGANPPGYGGQPPGYGGGPYPPSGQGRPPGGISPIMVAVLAIVLIAVLIIAVAVVVVTLRKESVQAVPPSPASPAQTATPAPETTEPEPSESPEEALVEDGWQQVRSTKYGLIYEVPKDTGWVVGSPGAMRGWEDDETGEVTSMSGTAGYRDGYKCKHRSLAELGTRGITDSDDTKTMGEGVGQDWALAAYTTKTGKPVVSTRSVKSFKANGLKGHHTVVDVKVKIEEKGCDPATAQVHTVAVPDGKGSRILIIDVHTGVKGALSGKQVAKIAGTLRDVDHELKD
ncbi:hypothetical protein [Murinocardiopsis flavida]|uniref:hypothetical protein n=1 Tax=Murinocardiopsis flavida TaxID=645275 RepID=UPI0011B26F69|nr:hypothetical protein [Murinocardiopsis flavida]